MGQNETGIIKTQAQDGGLILSNRQKQLIKIIVDVNTLIRYPLPKEEIEAWSVMIDRLDPEVPPLWIRFVMDKFATDELEWDANKGIQNIFNGLRRVYINNGRLKLSK